MKIWNIKGPVTFGQLLIARIAEIIPNEREAGSFSARTKSSVDYFHWRGSFIICTVRWFFLFEEQNSYPRGGNDNVGKFRERVSNRFGTKDDDRRSLSPVRFATCKPKLGHVERNKEEKVHRKKRATERKKKERIGTSLVRDAIHRILKAFRGQSVRGTTFHRSDVWLPFLKSLSSIWLQVAGIVHPVTW